jgi:CRP/FNR family transcriptional regulator
MKQKTCLIDDCSTCVQRPKAVLCNLAGEDLAAFEKIKRSLQYDPHQVVFYEGHACLGLYLLCAGKVKLTRSSPRGQRQIVKILAGGELIEKHAFKENAVHEVSCETLERSQICLIERRPYMEMVQQNPALAINLIQMLSSELGMHMDQLDQFTFKAARERLAALLLQLGERFGKRTDGKVQMGISLKREEVAEMAGVTAETVIRLLGSFRDEGLVTIDRRVITLLNPERLSRIARM